MDHHLQLRILEAALFTAKEPVKQDILQKLLPPDADIPTLIEELQALYSDRGIELRRLAKGYIFMTAEDLAPYLSYRKQETKKLSRAAQEVLAIIAYHQPITRAEIEEMRGVSLSRGTLDMLMEIGWIRPKGRRQTPGQPVTWGVTDVFLKHFGLADIGDLPGMEELRAGGFAAYQREFSIISMNPEPDERPDEEQPDEEEQS